MWLHLLQAGSQQCAPHHRPRMFGHWVTQPSAHTHLSLSFSSYFFLSLSRSHTLFSETMCPWGAYAMQRSNTNFTACVRYNLIFSAGEMEEWAKNKAPQTNSSSLSANCSVEISHSRFFHLIWFYRRCGCANTQSLHAALVFLLYRATVRKKIQNRRCWLDLPLQRFLESNHFRIPTARLQQKSRNFSPSADEMPVMNSLMAVIMTR